MAECITCGDDYSNKRYELGYLTCLNCGGGVALKQAKEKANRVAPIYNKGPTQYLSDATLKNDVRTLGRKV